MGLSDLLKRIALELDRNKIPYMLIGGQAVLLYGEPRLTKDIDITVGAGVESFQTLLSISNKLKLKILVDSPIDFMKQTFVLPTIDEASGFRVDFIFSYTIYEHQAIKRAVTKEIEGSKIKFASLEDLIIHKIFAGRSRDKEDIRNILLKNSDFDRSYIIKWLEEFDKSLSSRSLKTEFEEILNQLFGSN